MTKVSANIVSIDIEKASFSEAWKPEKREWIIMISLSVISFMVALDATILVTVLPVSSLSASRSGLYLIVFGSKSHRH